MYLFAVLFMLVSGAAPLNAVQTLGLTSEIVAGDDDDDDDGGGDWFKESRRKDDGKAKKGDDDGDKKLPPGGVPIVGGGSDDPSYTTLLKIVNCEGEVEYITAAMDSVVKAKVNTAEKEYEKSLKKWENSEKKFKHQKKDMLFDKVKPVKPITKTIKDDLKSLSVARKYRDKLPKKDFAVYEIHLSTEVLRRVSYAGDDAFIKAVADAEYAKLYNNWVNRGGTEDEQPEKPIVRIASDPDTEKNCDKVLKKMVLEAKKKALEDKKQNQKEEGKK